MVERQQLTKNENINLSIYYFITLYKNKKFEIKRCEKINEYLKIGNQKKIINKNCLKINNVKKLFICHSKLSIN